MSSSRRNRQAKGSGLVSCIKHPRGTSHRTDIADDTGLPHRPGCPENRRDLGRPRRWRPFGYPATLHDTGRPRTVCTTALPCGLSSTPRSKIRDLIPSPLKRTTRCDLRFFRRAGGLAQSNIQFILLSCQNSGPHVDCGIAMPLSKRRHVAALQKPDAFKFPQPTVPSVGTSGRGTNTEARRHGDGTVPGTADSSAIGPPWGSAREDTSPPVPLIRVHPRHPRSIPSPIPSAQSS